MRPESRGSIWEELEATAHLAEVQAIIREEIMRGEIRVVPAPGGGIRIIPLEDVIPVEEPAAAVNDEVELDEVRRAPVLRVKKRTR